MIKPSAVLPTTLALLTLLLNGRQGAVGLLFDTYEECAVGDLIPYLPPTWALETMMDRMDDLDVDGGFFADHAGELYVRPEEPAEPSPECDSYFANAREFASHAVGHEQTFGAVDSVARTYNNHVKDFLERREKHKMLLASSRQGEDLAKLASVSPEPYGSFFDALEEWFKQARDIFLEPFADLLDAVADSYNSIQLSPTMDTVLNTNCQVTKIITTMAQVHATSASALIALEHHSGSADWRRNVTIPICDSFNYYTLLSAVTGDRRLQDGLTLENINDLLEKFETEFGTLVDIVLAALQPAEMLLAVMTSGVYTTFADYIDATVALTEPFANVLDQSVCTTFPVPGIGTRQECSNVPYPCTRYCTQRYPCGASSCNPICSIRYCTRSVPCGTKTCYERVCVNVPFDFTTDTEFCFPAGDIVKGGLGILSEVEDILLDMVKDLLAGLTLPGPPVPIPGRPKLPPLTFPPVSVPDILTAITELPPSLPDTLSALRAVNVSAAPSVGVLCANGLLGNSNSVCCAASCGVCGGCNCAQLGAGEHSGASYCCPNTIHENALPCILASDVGCVVYDFPIVHSRGTSCVGA